MNQPGCEVIRDLLPSYVDGICSNESNLLIEEHFATCESCRALALRMKSTEIVSDKADAKAIDYLKKLKKHMTNKQLLSLGLLLCTAIAAMVVASDNSVDQTRLYYLLLPILMLGSYLMLSDYTRKPQKTKWNIGMSIVSLALIVYNAALLFSVIKWAGMDILPFGLEAFQVAPFAAFQLSVIAVVQIAIFIGTIWVSVKTKNPQYLLLDSCMTGCCLALAYIFMLSCLGTVETLVAGFVYISLTLAAEGLVIAAILVIVEHMTKKQLVGLGLLVCFAVAAMAVTRGVVRYVPVAAYYAILPVLLLGSYFMLSDYTPKRLKGGWNIGIGIVGLTLAGFGVLLLGWVFTPFPIGGYPLGMGPEVLGIFIKSCFLTIAVVLLAGFLGAVVVSVKTKGLHYLLLDGCMTGCCLALALNSRMGQLATVETLVASIGQIVIVLAAEGLVIAVIIAIVERNKRRRRSCSMQA